MPTFVGVFYLFGSRRGRTRKTEAAWLPSRGRGRAQQCETCDRVLSGPQYQGLSSDVVEELWKLPEYIDSDKNAAEKERRERALTAIREQEVSKKKQEEAVSQRVDNDKHRLDKVRQELGIQPQNVASSELDESMEKERQFKDEIQKFLETVRGNSDIQKTIDNFRTKTGTTENDLAIISRMATSTYDLIHKSGVNYDEIISGINIPNKEEFVADFGSAISSRLVEAASRTSKVRQITEKELIDGGQPDQAAGFVWFKGNARRPENAREVRFYVDARPEGVTNVAEYLGKVSDVCDQYGLRLQFKFRKDISEYDRTDTCVAYLYVPEAKDAGQKTISDQWVQQISKLISEVPKDAVKEQTSLFTNKIAKGVSSVEDTRAEGDKKGQSYTSQITKTIAETCGEFASKYNALDEKSIPEITESALQKLKNLNYI